MSYLGVLLPIPKYRVGAGPSLDDASVIVPADTIFGALCWAYSHLFGADECSNLLRGFANRRPPFLISSGFPAIYYDGKPTILLPIPHHDFFNKKFSEMISDKKKKINYVTLSAFNMFIDKKEEDLEVDSSTGYSVIKVKGESLPLIKIVREHRNTLDRLTKASDVYRMSYVKLVSRDKKLCGVCFFVKYLEGFDEGKLMSAIKAMGELGLGGKRALGFGVAQGPPLLLSIQVGKSNGDSFLTLSPYCPTKHEVKTLSQNLHEIYYSLTRRTAYYPDVGVVQYNCFSEGSCFPKHGGEVLGRAVKVNEQVIRYAYAFPVWWGH